MDLFPSYTEVSIRILLAVFGGAVVGAQREWHDKPAGLRTQMMVGLGAVMFTLVTLKLCDDMIATQAASNADPLRVVQGIIGGIGFLGAGTIIQARGAVKGITTAATIWVVGAFGIASGLGYYFLAISNIVLAMIILSVLGFAEKRFLRCSKNGNAKDADDGQIEG